LRACDQNIDCGKLQGDGQRSLWDAVLFGAPDPRKLMKS
jgi:hypothetical protein